MSEGNRFRFLICGYHGFGNIGDESILHSLLRKIREKFDESDPEIVVLSNKPQETQKQHNVSAFNRWNPFIILRELYRADIFISGGGGLLQDTTSNHSLWYYWFSLLGALLTRTPFFILGQGIGPIKNRVNKAITGFLLRKARFSLVRDVDSVDFLQEQGISQDKIIRGLDLALIDTLTEKARDRIFSTEDHPRIGVALKDLNPDREQILNTVASSLDALAEENELRSVLFSTHPSHDLPMIKELEEKMEEKPTILDTDHLSGQELVDFISDLNLVVAGRLHALIFALLARTPCIAICYDRKMENLVEEFANAENSPELKSWDPPELYQADLFFEDLLYVSSSGSKIRKQLEISVPPVQKRAEKKLDKALERIHNFLTNERG